MVLLLSALAPVAAVIVYIYVKDKYEKESKRYLTLAFVLGGVVSIIITTILYLFFDLFLPLPDDYSIWQQFVKAFFVVGFIDEFSKYLMVRGFLQPRTVFNEPYDGIIIIPWSSNSMRRKVSPIWTNTVSNLSQHKCYGSIHIC